MTNDAEPIPRPAQAGHRSGIQVVVTALCGSGTCPTVYRTGHGTFMVQGRGVTAREAGVDLPPGEGLVEVPAELLAAWREAAQD